MNKMTQIAAAGALTMAMSAAMAADSMNGTTLAEKGLTLNVNGVASITVPNDEAQMNWSVSAQAKTLKEATSQAVKAMNEGLSQIKTDEMGGRDDGARSAGGRQPGQRQPSDLHVSGAGPYSRLRD